MSEPLLEESPTEVESAAAWRLLLRNFWTLVFGEGVARVFGLVTILLIARTLGPGGLGLAAVGMAVVGWIFLVVDSGTELLTVRDVSREPARFREIAEKILGLRLTLGLLASAVYVLAVLLFARSDVSRTVYLGFAVAIPAMALNLRWIVLGVQGARSVALGNIAARFVFMLAVLAIVVRSREINLIGYGYGAAELVYAAVIWIAADHRYGLLRPRVDLAFWRATLRQSLPLMAGSLARGAMFTWDLFLIALILGPPAAGFYAAGQKPVQFLGSVVTMFYVSFVSSYSAASPALALRLLRRSARMCLAVAVPLAAAGSLGAAFVVPLAFGNRFASAIPVLAILVWKIPFSALSAPYSGLLLSHGRQLIVMRNSLVGAGVNIAGNLVAIPLFGVVGAAVVGVVSLATIMALNCASAVSRGLAPPLRISVASAR